MTLPSTNRALALLTIAGAALLTFASACSDDETSPPVSAASGCVDCHENEASLRATADPDDTPPPEDAGEG